MEYLSLNGLNKMLGDWVANDHQLQAFGFGQPYNQNGEPKISQRYPSMWANPTNAIAEQHRTVRTIQILIFDVLLADRTNEISVISDCEEIAFRLVRWFRLASDAFLVEGNPSIEPFTDKFLDDVAGVIINIQVEFNAESADCNDPIDNFNIKTTNV